MPQGPFNTLVAKILGQNSYSPLALGKQGDLSVSDFHGRKYQQAYNGAIYRAATQTADTMSNGLATTYVGICLSNPNGSTKNLSVRGIAGALDVAPAGEFMFGLIVGYAAGGITVHTTALTPMSAKIGAATTGMQGLADAACTLVGTPAWAGPLVSNAASTNNASFFVDLEGSLLIPPGGYVAVGSFGAAGPASGFMGSIEWEEVAP